VEAPIQPALVEARGLVKRFDALVAVDGVDFDVQRGEAFGFLGPNGAGKTSTMRMIGCVSPPTGGTLRILGLDPVARGAEIRSRLGVVPQQDTLDFELTVRENVIIYGRYFGLRRSELRRRADELLEFVQLTERADSRVEPLSGGLRRRLTIARSLVNDPDVLPLDEPTTGLDPQARHTVWDRLFRLKQRGVTLILTTHYMDEAEQLCDRLVVMDKGKIAAEGSPQELIRRYSTREWSSSASAWTNIRKRSQNASTASPGGSRRCLTICCCTPKTVMQPPPACTSWGSNPRACSSAAQRWRTSSST
jgi:lipooligosaccharide transport system ATP-binding protein